MTHMATEPPFRVIIDSREQAPLEFPGIETVRGTLKTGDYSVEVAGVSWANRVAIERKSYSDMWGSMSTDRRRFERCIQRLAQLDHAAIVIECSLTELAVQPSRIQRCTPASVIGGLISWSVQYRIPVWFADNRTFAARIVIRILSSYWKHRGHHET